jgi:hypothetical protein
MDDKLEHSHEPTVDDLRVKLCYICREEERHDSALLYARAYANANTRLNTMLS